MSATVLPSSLKPSAGETEGVRRANRRLLRRALKERGRVLMESCGYLVGQPLNLKRGYAFEANRNGTALKVGIRASADRWLALTKPSLAVGGEIATVDEILVMTFRSAKDRDVAQLWRFDAKVVADMAVKVFEASGKAGQQWLPLDDTQDADVHSMAAGSLAKHGKLLVEEPVVWADSLAAGEPDASDEEDEQETTSAGPEAPGALKLTIAQAKAGLAAQFGVNPASIKITIEG